MFAFSIILIVVGLIFAYVPGLQILFIFTLIGVYLSIWDIVRSTSKRRNERARFLMMSYDEAQSYINSIHDPETRMKLIKDWRQNHTSTQL